MPYWFYAVMMFGIGISILIGYNSLYIVSLFAFIFNILFGWYLLPVGVSILIYVVFALVWGRLFYDIFATRKVA